MHKDNRLPIEPFIKGYKVENSQFSPDGKKLAYLRKSDQGKDLVIFTINERTHTNLLFQEEISTGTAYGGETYCWSHDGRSIFYSSKGKLNRISVEGGEAKEVISITKSFHPKCDDKGLYFITEHEDHMSLAYSNNADTNLQWPQKVPINFHFIYDPDRDNNGNFVAHVWNYPHMSWNGSSIIRVDDRGEIQTIAGGDNIYTAQPRFSPNGNHLAFLSEENGWLNLWIADGNGKNKRILVQEQAEHSYSTWVSGSRNHVWLDNTRILFTRNRGGFFTLAITDLEGNITELELPRGYYEELSSDHNGQISFSFSNYRTRKEIHLIRISQDNKLIDQLIVEKSGLALEKYQSDLVKPQELTFPTRDGGEAHGLIYYPDKDGYTGLRPLLIDVHGGPTGMYYDKFRLEPQYFVKQGWVVLGINHRGSIGYGKEFREILNGNWGIYDVDDTVDAVEYLSEQGEIDPDKVAIMGGSAGGFTTLIAMIRYPGVFSAGVDLYGVADLFLLAEETHYLEAHYMDVLIGKLPDEAEKYYQRSPINFAFKIEDPLLILQGEDDPVVPKNQSELIKSNVGGIVEYKLYEDEGHGFKKISTLQDMYPRIDSFLNRYVINSFSE